jgi:hypothetical protein
MHKSILNNYSCFAILKLLFNVIIVIFLAVREDRMPGGRNSGAVYNLYKVPVSGVF